MIEIIDDREIGAVDFLGGYPQDVLRIGFGLGNTIFKFRVSWGFNWWVFFELAEKVWILFHLVNWCKKKKMLIGGELIDWEDFFYNLKLRDSDKLW
jgi:hypothetical protein